MPDINHVLSSSKHYRQAFEDGLSRILQYKTAGTFILGCANLYQHPDFLKNNQTLLDEVYNLIKEHYQACHRDNRLPDDAADDIAVMNSLIEIGLGNLEAVEYRKVNNRNIDYLLNYNQLRSFRPARMSKTETTGLDIPFSPDGFHFDKPFLEKEIFAEGEIDGRRLSLLYNKFPFVHYHALLVVDKADHNNQFLTQAVLDYIAHLQIRTQQHSQEFVIAYNSLRAGASVNHCHFHTYLETIPLPIFSQRFAHNGGDQPYPAACLVFNNSLEAWQAIDKLNNNNIPYNLLLKDKKIYCLPRKPRQEDATGIDASLFGWSQMAGLINVDNRNMLTKITADQLISALRSVSATV
jgi:ATP adenylyltransferase/5',5'''-P-1,P-4-tetraphosphate phosphorylase II